MNKSVDPKQLSLSAREEMLLQELPPNMDTKSPAFLEDLKKIVQIGRESAAIEPVRLLPSQDELTAYVRDDGTLIIEQQCWPDENQVLRVAEELVPHFIDRLTDLLGIGSAGRS